MEKKMLKSILARLQEALHSLYGERLVSLILFGSQARGDASTGSDIDVLVVLKGSVAPEQEFYNVSDTVYNLSLEFDTVLSCLFVSETRYQQEKSPLILNIRREGIQL